MVRFTPAHPADRWPRRTSGVVLNDVVSWSEKRVIEELGRPDQRSAMARSPRRLDGYFGPPGPPSVPPDAPYEMWYYHNVGGSTCVLYLAQPPTSAARAAAREGGRMCLGVPYGHHVLSTKDKPS